MCAIVQIGKSTVAWQVKKTELVALSSAEAEICAATLTTKLTAFSRDITQQMQMRPARRVDHFPAQRIPIYVDNQAAIA